MSGQRENDLDRGHVPEGDDVVNGAGRQDATAVRQPHANEVRVSRSPEFDDVKTLAAVRPRRIPEQELARGHREDLVRVRNESLMGKIDVLL